METIGEFLTGFFAGLAMLMTINFMTALISVAVLTIPVAVFITCLLAGSSGAKKVE
jgi:hypothetical protein